MDLTVKEALALPPGRKIVLQHNTELQPVGQIAGLLSGFFESLGADFQQLPICENSWKTMNKDIKEHAFDQVKEKCRKNALNHSKQLYTHTAGSKSMARKDTKKKQLHILRAKMHLARSFHRMIPLHKFLEMSTQDMFVD
ncbi:uncharacterized protein [Arachis hypogaea]|uniref:uncharacterized protein isoform X1 n=1 Tax=Arachis hypogaea TaxID=3818 RepID=UPI003B2126C8